MRQNPKSITWVCLKGRELKLYNMKTKMGLPENHPLQMKKKHLCHTSIIVGFHLN